MILAIFRLLRRRFSVTSQKHVFLLIITKILLGILLIVGGWASQGHGRPCVRGEPCWPAQRAPKVGAEAGAWVFGEGRKTKKCLRKLVEPTRHREVEAYCLRRGPHYSIRQRASLERPKSSQTNAHEHPRAMNKAPSQTHVGALTGHTGYLEEPTMPFRSLELPRS